MAFPYDTSYNNNVNNLPPPPAPVSFPSSEPDEISCFLQQFLLATTPRNATQEVLPPYPGRISVPELNSGWFLPNGSSSGGTLENDTDEYDGGESEEGVEALVGEAALKKTQRRNSSKRSRAAEVHNLSEKRRRSRINEKMKALQNLIPNSNKTDKASMLDEAIEYLKQLQLQVQMLTMRNGGSLYPVCVPGMIQPDQVPQMTLDMLERNKSVNSSLAKLFGMNQDLSADNLVGLHEKPVADFPTVVGSQASFDVASSSHSRFIPFQGIGREEVINRHQLIEEYPGTGLTAFPMVQNKRLATSNLKAAKS